MLAVRTKLNKINNPPWCRLLLDPFREFNQLGDDLLQRLSFFLSFHLLFVCLFLSFFLSFFLCALISFFLLSFPPFWQGPHDTVTRTPKPSPSLLLLVRTQATHEENSVKKARGACRFSLSSFKDHADKQTERNMERDRDRQTDRQTDRERERERERNTQSSPLLSPKVHEPKTHLWTLKLPH